MSGRRLSFNDTDYDNTNANVAPHLAKVIASINLARMAKNHCLKKGVGTGREDDLQSIGTMKRIGNIYKLICSWDNIMLANQRARKGKGGQHGIKQFDKARGCNLMLLHYELVSKSYKTSPYKTFKVYEPKERVVYQLPFRDRIAQHAIMNELEGVFTAMFTADSYSCIKGKGIHGASYALRDGLKDHANSEYYLQLDIKKFYPSVDHDVLKALLRRKFKDTDLLWLLYSIIDSAPGIPIGNYLSQYFANFYLTYFDHWLKEQYGALYYYRYADDIVLLSGSKDYLHAARVAITEYLRTELNLIVKGNYKVCPVSTGINFVGYVHYHTHVRLRPSIKKRFARKLKRGAGRATIASYTGWTKHGNCKNLVKKLLHERKEF